MKTSKARALASEPEQVVPDAATRSFAVAGSGGAGVLTAGNLLLEAAGRAGWYGYLSRTVGPQIRGGEAAALLRLSERPVQCASDWLDVLIALDWQNIDRFGAELPLGPRSTIVSDSSANEIPPRIKESGAGIRTVPIGEIAGAIANGKGNMVVAGMIAELASLPEDVVRGVLQVRLGHKGEDALEGGIQCIAAGRKAARNLGIQTVEPPGAEAGRRWILTGNEATALGAIRGGVRFVAAYPITPATEILEWLAGKLPAAGGTLLQAEDELASINMIIGASFGGTPALTATSGPGLALMCESISLAVSAEIPVVIIDVMRGGPSTGIPTKSEQSDLNIALYGVHGDAPHLVLAPNSTADCIFTSQWAIHLAEAMQVPAIVLSDQILGQTRAIIDKPADVSFIAHRETAERPEPDFCRYAVTESGVSPMSLPGTPGGEYVADGLEHAVEGRPSSAAEDHAAQLDKRQRKLVNFNYGSHWADIEGDSELAIITWGSVTAQVREALDKLSAEGCAGIRLISIRLLAPALPEAFADAMTGVTGVLVVEQTHSGQFLRYLRAHYGLPGQVQVLHRAGPLPIQVEEICSRIKRWVET